MFHVAVFEFTAACTKLQALVYDILPLEKGAGKRCSECEPVYAPMIFDLEM